MFESLAPVADTAAIADLEAVRTLLAGVRPASGTTLMLEQIRELEELTSLVAAVQAEVTAAFVPGRREEQVAAGLRAKRVGLGISQEIGLARRDSPSRAGRYAGWPTILTSELPCTLKALRAGQTSEWRAMLVARETGWLSAEDRAVVDADIGPRLCALGDRAVEAEAQRLAYTFDPHGLVKRFERAAAGRRVGLRPAPEGMSRLGAQLPLTQGVAAFAALDAAARAAQAAGDPRSRGQVMADTLVERVTGQVHAEDVRITVDLVITDQALFQNRPGANEPATVAGFGPIPAPVARDLITRNSPAAAATASPSSTSSPRSTASATSVAAQGQVEIRRLFTDPAGRLVSMETQGRFFTPAMAEFVRLRDQWCTTPFCGAPIRHVDHLFPWAYGGRTSLINAAGRCESCNYAKEAPGWSVTTLADGSIGITTPTGHDQATFTRARPPDPAPTDPSTTRGLQPGSLAAPRPALPTRVARRARHARVHPPTVGFGTGPPL